MKFAHRNNLFKLQLLGLLTLSALVFFIETYVAINVHFLGIDLTDIHHDHYFRAIESFVWLVSAAAVGMGVMHMCALKQQLGATPDALHGLVSSLLPLNEQGEPVAANQEASSLYARLQQLQNTQQKMYQQQALEKAHLEALLQLHQQADAAIAQFAGVMTFTPDGKITSINAQLLSTFGYSELEVIGKHHDMFVGDAEKNQDTHRQLWASLTQGKAVSATVQRVDKAGHVVWLEVSYHPIRDAQGKLLHVVQYAIDVTASIEASAQAQLLSMVANENNIAATVTDPEGRVIYVNKGFTDLTGYTFDEVRGKKPGQVLQGEHSSAETIAQIRQAIQQQTAIECEIINYTKQGLPYWINLKINPVFDSQGQLIRFVSLQSNIDEAKLKNLEISARLDAVSASMATIELSTDGYVLTANQNFCQTMGYALHEIVGKHHSHFVTERLKSSEEYQLFWQKLNRGEYDTGQYERVNKAGEVVWLQASYNPVFDLQCNVIKVVKFAMDVTAAVNQSHALGHAVDEIKHLVKAAKACDISQRLTLASDVEEIISLYDGVNTLVENMSEVILHLEEAGDTIGAVAHSISEENGHLAERTDQQAEQIEDTADKMDKLAATIWQNAENAKTASDFATEATDVAVQGGDMVGDVINTMAIINQSSEKIQDIISVIDSIAFQTNILALNAAVEAARAGDQGKGFAVVAGEVRNLAQRSAEAAKEIKNLISDSVTKVQEGVRLVQDAGITMERAVTSVKRVTKIIGEITEASFEQGLSVAQLNNTVASMKVIGQQNTALVQSITHSVGQLLNESSAVTSRASQYQLAIESRNRFAAEHAENFHLAEAINVVPFAKQEPAEHKTTVKEKKAVNDSANPGWILF